jgi:hypothetical protein
MPDLINWSLLREPLNWIIVILMLLIGTFGLRLLMQNAS